MYRKRRGVACVSFFFFNDTATTEIYTLSLHDALPIYFDGDGKADILWRNKSTGQNAIWFMNGGSIDRKSTRLNSSHSQISYAVFCLKKKNTVLNLSPGASTEIVRNVDRLKPFDPTLFS